MAKMNAKAEELESLPPLDTKTLTGDMRDAVMARIRSMKKSYEEMSESDQRELVDDVSRFTKHVVDQVIHLVAAGGRQVVTGTMDKVTVKDGFQAVIKIPQTEEMRHELVDSVGQAVLLIVADKEKFTGEKAPYPVDADEPDFLRDAA